MDQRPIPGEDHCTSTLFRSSPSVGEELECIFNLGTVGIVERKILLAVGTNGSL